jgi:hypothetical protein
VEVDRLRTRVAELEAWKDEAVRSCAERGCSTRDRRLRDAEARIAELEAERDEARRKALEEAADLCFRLGGLDGATQHECVAQLRVLAKTAAAPSRGRRNVEHEPDCPRIQFWDAGELDCPCTCHQTQAEYAEPCATCGGDKTVLEAEVAYLRACCDVPACITVEEETAALDECDRLYDKWQRLLPRKGEDR